MFGDTRYQFFLSSTFEDLREERQQVVQAILEMGHIPVGMEVFPSTDEGPWDIIRHTIAESDYYIVLSAGRYGSCFPDGRSFTEREFDLAAELGIPTIGFIRRNFNDLPASRREDDVVRRGRLSVFHAKIRQKHVRTWGSVEELGLQSSKAIIFATRSHPRVGWVRADHARSTADLEKLEKLRGEIDRLESEVKKLEEENASYVTLVQRSVLPEEDVSPPLLAQGGGRPIFYACSLPRGRR